MTDPISSVVPLQAYQPQRRADPELQTAPAPAPAAPDPVVMPQTASAAPAASPSKVSDPVALSVDRDETGVFVYTLTDSASGRVLAVIPRSAVVTSAQQQSLQGVDIQA